MSSTIIRLLHGTAILVASVTWYFKTNGELRHPDVCRLLIAFPLSLPPLLPTAGPAGPCHCVPLAVGLPALPLCVAAPPWVALRSPGGASLTPSRCRLRAHKPHHLPLGTSSKDLQKAMSGAGQGQQVLLPGGISWHHPEPLW